MSSHKTQRLKKEKGPVGSSVRAVPLGLRVIPCSCKDCPGALPVNPVSVIRQKLGNTWAPKEAGVCGFACWELQGRASQGAEFQGSRRQECGPGSYRVWDRTQMETSSQAGGLAGEDTNTGSGTSAGQTDLCPAWPCFSKLPQSYTNSQGGQGTQEVQSLALTPPERPRQMQIELSRSPAHIAGAGQIKQLSMATAFAQPKQSPDSVVARNVAKSRTLWPEWA